MADSGLPSMLGGPYRAPDVRIGELLWCAYRGTEQVVGAFSSGPIPWPCRRGRNGLSFIVCGDMVPAIRAESSQVMQAWWDVSAGTVGRWRRALDVGINTAGTRRLRQEVKQQHNDLNRKEKPRSIKPHPPAAGRRKPDPDKLPPYVPLQHGPYHAPAVQVGDLLFCSRRRKEVKVEDWTEGPVVWPLTRVLGSYSLIVCGDLKNALQVESNVAIAWAWGVSISAIGRWRQTLGILQKPSAKPLEADDDPVSLKGSVMETSSELPVLLYGPYRAPHADLGDRLWCEYRQGEVAVETFSSGPIPWPCVRHGHVDCPILCGDLARAVRLESSQAVRAWWNVTANRVSRWRRVLGVAAINDGTRQLREAVRQEFFGPEGEAKPRPKEPRPFAANRQKLRKFDSAVRRDWTAEEEKLLGTMPDAKLALQLGCSKNQVWRRRHELDLPHFLAEGRQPWTLRPSMLVVDAARLKQRREKASWTRKELAALAGVNYVHYSMLESGEYAAFRRSTAERIARALECTPEDIAVDAAPQPPELPKSIHLKRPAEVARWHPRAPTARKTAKLPMYAPLRHGPYQAPVVKPGDVLFCTLRGREVTVADFSEGALAWPRTRVGANSSLILCGDLEKAVRLELRAAVAWEWSVSVATVRVWRQAIRGLSLKSGEKKGGVLATAAILVEYDQF